MKYIIINTKYIIINTIIAMLFILSIVCNIWLITTKPKIVTDVKTVHDTTVIVKDSIQKHTVIKDVLLYDTIIQTIVDTDTIYIPIDLPITYKTYTNKLCNNNIEYDVTINYSGYKSEIEDVTIQSKYLKENITNIKQNPWRQTISIGVQIGCGMQLTPQQSIYSFGPYIGIGIQYGFGYTW